MQIWPYYFGLWNSEEFVHVKDFNDEWTDEQIWEDAKKEKLTIITKDSDFSSKIIMAKPPPKVIHLRIGNLKMKDLHSFLNDNWPEIVELLSSCKLINVYRNKIEGIN